jgi:hypothetical protein
MNLFAAPGDQGFGGPNLGSGAHAQPYAWHCIRRAGRGPGLGLRRSWQYQAFHPGAGREHRRLLPEAKLSEAELKEVRALRAKVGTLVAAHRQAQAAKIEEQAMLILGFKKLWPRCGPGTFLWMKLAPVVTQ